MTWVKLDDQFPDHPKIIAAGGEAAWLYVAGLCYCSAKLTDGMIPSAMISRLTDRRNAPRLAEKLVEVGLWEDAEGGYMVHDYGDYQPLASLVKARHESQTEAKRRAGKLGGVASGIARAKAKQDASTSEAESNQHASRLVEAESKPRPDPSQRASDEARKNLAAMEPAAEKSPLYCTRAEALAAIAAASGGRFVASPPLKGGAFKLDRLRKRPDVLAVCAKVGKWLADGGDEYKGRVDGRHIGSDLDAWVAQAEAMAPAAPPVVWPESWGKDREPAFMTLVLDRAKNGNGGDGTRG